MRRLPWHLAVRADRRALLTALGVALGVAFTVVSFAVPDGLHTEAIDPEGPFGRQDLVVMGPGLAPFAHETLDVGESTRVRLATVALADGSEVTLAAFEGERAPPLQEGVAYPPAGARGLPRELRVAGADAPLPWGEAIDLPLLSRAWIAVAPATLDALCPDLVGMASYLLVRPPVSADTTARLEAEGFVLAPAPAVEPFFRASAIEIARDLLLVVAFSGVLVALFTYEFLRSEVRERWREIGVWRSLGMRPIDVGALLLGRALAIVAAGALAGAGVGHVILTAAARASGSAVFTPSIGATTAGLLAAAFLLAGALGGLVPAWVAVSTPVREQLEAPA